MGENCNHDCSSCANKCKDNTDFSEKLNELSSVKKVIGVISGKGGVGKSFVTSLLASISNKKGKKTAILDADITGPSIPKMFGVNKKAEATENNLIIPPMTKSGIDIMSINLLLENETDPVVWRGPVIAGVVKQFWTDVIWNEVDYMFVDMPPGTGDVPLTVFQSLPVDGIIIVTTPQDLVSMIVEKAVKMANLMNIPIVGIIENMSYFECPDCHKKHYIFGESNLDGIAKQYDIKATGKIPINPEFARLCDKGEIDKADINLDLIFNAIEKSKKSKK